jgi:hypothetical protein
MSAVMMMMMMLMLIRETSGLLQSRLDDTIRTATTVKMFAVAVVVVLVVVVVAASPAVGAAVSAIATRPTPATLYRHSRASTTATLTGAPRGIPAPALISINIGENIGEVNVGEVYIEGK